MLPERLLLPSSHRKSIAVTVCWSTRQSVTWIACNSSSTPLLGCCATGENTITLHRSSVMFYTASQFLFESSLRSVYWSTSRFIGPRLGIFPTIVRSNDLLYIRSSGGDLAPSLGDGNVFRGPRFLNDVFPEKISIFTQTFL